MIASREPEPTPDASRARYPDASGEVIRDGVRVVWDRYGAPRSVDGRPTILLTPTWSIIHSRFWKAQIPYLARHYRLVTWDGRGNGRSDRPQEVAAYDHEQFAADGLAVLDATGTDRAVVVGLSAGASWTLLLAARHPERVAAAVFIAPALPVDRPAPSSAAPSAFDQELDSYEGWDRYNRHAWRRDYDGFLEFFFAQCYTESHSTKPIEDCIAWAHETDAETLIRTQDARRPLDGDAVAALVRDVRCPTLVIHGAEDAVCAYDVGEGLARLTGGSLLTLDASGHIPPAREPVQTNLALRAFVDSLPGVTPTGGETTSRRWRRALSRPRRVLYLSSPIGLGHAMRDAAIADELRLLQPDLEIDWLAQHPVTSVLEARGERVHPLSGALASESAHITAEAAGHDLNAFQAIRRMDEILVANFMVFHDAVAAGEYDLVIGDEAWEVDHFLHENPEHKRTAFAWLTDFVGWLPMQGGGEREARLTADYNAEMIEHVERFPRLRDRAIFVGSPDDIVPDGFGPGLPLIRDWTERHFAFSGYVTGFDPTPLLECREELRAELGYCPDERVVIASVGGSGVGETLLRGVVAAYPAAARLVPGLRMIAVAGPRIDPGALDAPPGVEVRAFVPDLYRHLVACDLAVVQGGLTTTMELAAARRPFLYFPLENHFEQQRHVRHRLERYGAGRCMRFDESPPEAIAAAIAAEIDRPVRTLPVEADGAARAAALIAPLL